METIFGYSQPFDHIFCLFLEGGKDNFKKYSHLIRILDQILPPLPFLDFEKKSISFSKEPIVVFKRTRL